MDNIQHIASAAVDQEAVAKAVVSALAPAKLPGAVVESVASTASRMARSLAALGPAMSAVRGAASPQLARALMATENVWASVEAEFGLLTSMDVAALIGSKKSSRSLAADQRAAGKIMGVRRGNAYRYPGFQFDRANGRVIPAIPSLIAAARDVGWDDEDLILWLVSPSGYVAGGRPVDHLEDPDLVNTLVQAATVQW